MTVENISIDVKTNAAGAAHQLRSLSSALSGVRGAAKSVSSGGASKAVSSIGHAAKSATGFMGKLLSSIKRIAFYRLLRTAIKEITQAFQEGLKHAYAFSKAVGGDLAKALDSVSSAGAQMKNQMGAALGELLQTLQPIIEAIISLVTRLMAALSALFAALGGRLTYSLAEETADEWDKATGAAKKYKNTILGFDEINRLNDETGGGGGGGGSTGSFKDIDLPEWALKIKDLMDKLRDLFDIGKYMTAGGTLAEWLNDLIDSWDAYEAGRKLGEKINHVIDFAYGFLKKFNFEKFGGKIADFLNGAIKTINWNRLGRTLVRGFTGLFDFVIGFIKKIDTGAIATAISDFILGVFDEAVHWIGEHDWKEFGGIVSQKISDFLTNVKWGEIAKSASTFLSDAFNAIADFLDGVDWEQITTDAFNAFKEFVKNIDWDSIGQSAWHLFSSAFTAAGKVLRIVFNKLGIDAEGNVSAEEITDFLMKSVLPVGGAILGWKTAGLGGAAIGLAVGTVLSFEFQKYIEGSNGQIDYQDLMDKIIKVALPIAGAIIGWKLGGIGGAAIGLTLGIAVSLLFNNFVNAEGGFTWDTLSSAIFNSGVLPVAGAIIGWKLGGFSGGVIGLTLGASISLLVKDLGGVNGALDLTKILQAICKDVLPAALGATVGAAIGGMPGALIGMTIGVAISFFVSSTSWTGGWDIVGQMQQKMNAELYGVRMNADGGSMANDGTLFVAGEAGPEIVANMGSRTGVMNVDQMEAAVANGNMGVINAVYAMANMIVKAVNEIDPDITIDGESFADKMYNYNQNAAKRRGAAMVT